MGAGESRRVVENVTFHDRATSAATGASGMSSGVGVHADGQPQAGHPKAYRRFMPRE